jgi:CspA family cold shock protein
LRENVSGISPVAIVMGRYGMVSGRVVRFDEVRGYGFVTPDDGGDDVFVHVNDLLDDKYAFSPGTHVEFEVMDSARGPKGYDVRVLGSEGPPAGGSASQAVARRTQRDENGTCEILSPGEFRHELTEAFLQAAPDLTAAQILRLRERVIALASAHEWLED